MATVTQGSKNKAIRKPGAVKTSINKQTQAGNNGNLGQGTPNSDIKGAPGSPAVPSVSMKSGTVGGSSNAMKSGTP